MNRREVLLGAAGATLLCACRGHSSPKDSVVATMKRATNFMREHCAVNGGYVWNYAADFSRRWGEMEAYPTMIWIQPPGTTTMGHLFLDCYNATGDKYYYEASAEVAEALVAAQHASGGWNYLHDFTGEASTRRWYDTIGRNGWRLEEFHHYYGNATFDDAATAEAARFFLRLYLARREERYLAPLQRVIGFMLGSQYENGGWPQRFPFVDPPPTLRGKPDYTRHVTFNDDVVAGNIRFLLMVWQALGDSRALDAVKLAMNIFVETQQPSPQPGWGLQHHAVTLRPAAARSYEPESLATHPTAGNISMMLDFYEWTAEEQFLARLPDAMEWLESVRLASDEVRTPGREFPTHIEIGTNRPLYVHRRGSNVVNGEYYHDYSPDRPISHSVQWRAIDLDALRARYESLQAVPADTLRRKSPLVARRALHLPGLFSSPNGFQADRPVATLIETLNDEGYWPAPLTRSSNPYIGSGPATPAAGDYFETSVGDEYDTSPFIPEAPEEGITTWTFVRNMSALMRALDRADGLPGVS